MKFICTSELNDLHAAFEKDACDGQDFQGFVEESRATGESLCLDTKEIEAFLEKIRDDDYDYLLECDDQDLQFYGGDYLKRMNFFSRLLGEKAELTIEDIKQDRKLSSGGR
jgi:hypothetical protein